MIMTRAKGLQRDWPGSEIISMPFAENGSIAKFGKCRFKI
jgi:hypothetical protein